MARPSRCRRICAEPAYDSFIPEGIPCGSQVTLTLDEYEVIRLIDLEKLTHEQCARQMDISRTTVTGISESAREKIADCIVNGKPFLIARRELPASVTVRPFVSAGRFAAEKAQKPERTAEMEPIRNRKALGPVYLC